MHSADFIQCRPIESIIPYAGNPRRHSKAQIKQIARSIERFGWVNPIVVDGAGVIVAGHGRFEAAAGLGVQTLPVVCVEHLSEEEVRLYRLADNKLAENSDWDVPLLRFELDYLVEVNVDIDLSGFSTPELDIALGIAEVDHVENPAPVSPPEPDKTVSKLGDIWELGAHRVMCGDCRSNSALDQIMGNQSARMVLTDPPYNVPVDGHVCGLGGTHHAEFAMASGEMTTEQFIVFLCTVLTSLARVSMGGALHYVAMDWRHLRELLTAAADVYSEQVNCCVWVKSNGGMGSFYRSRHEVISVFKVGKGAHVNNIELGRHGRYRTNVWEYAGMNAFGEGREEGLALHPTVKPVRMFADAILDASHRDDIVLDGFLGSGTTLLAAEQVGRRAYCIEIDPGYVDVAIRRWMALTGEEAVLAGEDSTFREVAVVRGVSLAREG